MVSLLNQHKHERKGEDGGKSDTLIFFQIIGIAHLLCNGHFYVATMSSWLLLFFKVTIVTYQNCTFLSVTWVLEHWKQHESLDFPPCSTQAEMLVLHLGRSLWLQAYFLKSWHVYRTPLQKTTVIFNKKYLVIMKLVFVVNMKSGFCKCIRVIHILTDNVRGWNCNLSLQRQCSCHKT